jgi:hypothetical protein
MEVIQFPSRKSPLDFDGMGIKIDVEKQCESWDSAFTSVQTALRFCNFDHVEAEKAALVDSDILDEMGAHWAESVEYLRSIVATMKAALVRLEISKDRALGRTRQMTMKPEERASIAQAIARCEAAQAAYDARPHDDDGAASRLSEAESDAIEILAETPCASDAEFLEKLRFLVARETRIFGPPDCNQEFGPIAVAANLHF